MNKKTERREVSVRDSPTDIKKEVKRWMSDERWKDEVMKAENGEERRLAVECTEECEYIKREVKNVWLI